MGNLLDRAKESVKNFVDNSSLGNFIHQAERVAQGLGVEGHALNAVAERRLEAAGESNAPQLQIQDPKAMELPQGGGFQKPKM